MMNLKKSILLLFICGVFGDEVKKVSVMEGESVTLNSDLTDIQKYWLISWKIEDKLIAQISEGKISYKNGSDESFRDRLQLDSKTASLTITNMRLKHSGVYKLEAASSSSSSGTTRKTFTVSVYESPSAIHVVEAEMKSVSVKTGESLTLQTDVLQPRDQLIVWRFGDKGKLIAKADLEANNSLHEDERFSDRLKLNNQDGSLTITQFRNTDSGLYMVKISSSKQTLHKRFIVNVIDSGWSSGAVIWIVVVVAVAAVVVAAGFLYYRWKMGEEKKENVKEGEPVTLNTGVTELHTDDKIQWCYEDNLIAELTGGKEQIYDVADERFSGKLTLDEKTGNLNISNIKFILSGLYNLKITRNRVIRHKRFILTVNLNTELATVGKPLTLSIPTGIDLKEDDLILWKFGPKGCPIAKFDKINKVTMYDSPDERFRDGLKLNDETGSLTITKFTTEHAGVYKLQLSNGERTTSRKFRVTVAVSVKEGETARLKTGVENLQNVKIYWRFGVQNSPLAEIKEEAGPIIYHDVFNGRFKGRLELNKKTGTLSIKNINTDDSGEYRIWFKSSTNKNTLLKFAVSVSQNGASESTTVGMPLLSL